MIPGGVVFYLLITSVNNRFVYAISERLTPPQRNELRVPSVGPPVAFPQSSYLHSETAHCHFSLLC